MDWQKSQEKLNQLNIGGSLEYQETLTSSVTTSWGVEWDEELIARDIMQNFFDANRDRLSDIDINIEGSQVTITAPTQFNLMRLFYLGSEKGGDDVGQYGEGFKAAVMCLMRDYRVEPIAISGNSIVCMRISEKTVAGTELRPVLYDFFNTSHSCDSSQLILQGCSKKLREAFKTGLDHFFHSQNSLIGDKLWASPDGRFAIYRSTEKNVGHVFYRKLKRGEIPEIPVVLVINKEYAAIEKKIKHDRDRNAFGEAVMKTFYNIFARYAVRGHVAGQRSIVEAAGHCWFRGHALLRAIADSQPWRGTCWSKEDTKAVFGNKYFARVSTRDIIDVLKYEKVEQKWQGEDRQGLPGYFRNFGVVDAVQYLANLEEKALDEAKNKHSRQPTSAENNCIEILHELANDLDPKMMKAFGRGRATYCVAETEVLLGQLKDETWGPREVVIAASIFLADFSEAVAVFLHEYSHIFGSDGNRNFSDALTELLGVVIKNRKDMDVYEELWNDARTNVRDERNESESNNNKEIEVLLNSKNEAELRELLQCVPNRILKRLLEPNESKVAAYLGM